MSLAKLSVGKNAPEIVNVIIENPMGGTPVKYEFDKESEMIFVDRIIHTAMYYPGNYGFIPHTLSDDGDPVDVLVLGQHQIMPGAVMAVRPIGVLLMEDESGGDEKIIAVPSDKLHPYYKDVKSYKDIQPIILEQIEHFFTHYKDLEKNKWVKIAGWDDENRAKALITEGIERYQK
jgi:inorganic pyrophosphatase